MNLFNATIAGPLERMRIAPGEQQTLTAVLRRGLLRRIRFEQQNGQAEDIRIKRITLRRSDAYDIFAGDSGLDVLAEIPTCLQVLDGMLLEVTVLNTNGQSVWVSFSAWCHVV